MLINLDVYFWLPTKLPNFFTIVLRVGCKILALTIGYSYQSNDGSKSLSYLYYIIHKFLGFICKIVQEYKAYKVYAKREVAYEEKQKESLVQSELFKLRCEFETFSTSTLYHAEDLPFSIKDIPDVFTNFRKKTEKDATIRNVFKKPTAIKSPELSKISLPTLKDLG